MTADEIRTHIRYSHWASRRLLQAAMQLSEPELHRDLKVSHGSLMGTLAHIHLADRIWFSRVVDPTIRIYLPNDSLPDERLEAEWSDVQKRWEEWSGTLDDDDLKRIVSYWNLKGEPGATPVWQIVLHVVNHATLHRGQAMGMLRQLGVPPPATDLIFYYREQN